MAEYPEFRTDRRGVVLDQLATSLAITRDRLAGLTAAEYTWEPAPGMWSVRRRGEGQTGHAAGAGDWLLDYLPGEPRPAPLTTIAWRIAHLTTMFELRWEWTFGGHARLENDLHYAADPDTALAHLYAATERWLTDCETLSEAELDQVGRSQYPDGLDPQLPIIAIMWWVNREFIHHASETALLRDLYPRLAPNAGSAWSDSPGTAP